MVEISLLSATQTREHYNELVDIYQAAFAEPPFHETLPDFMNFAGRLSYHLKGQNFRCAVARPAPDQPLVGFCYGYPGYPGSWFYDLVSLRIPAERLREYLSDYFELAELAVHPQWQRQGIGGKLHDALLAGLPHQTACLSTPQVECQALYLYRSRGWETLATQIDLPGTTLKYQVLGKKLAT